MDKRMMLKGNAKLKPTKNYFLKDNFQEILVAIFVQRRLSAMISPFILKKKNQKSQKYFRRIVNEKHREIPKILDLKKMNLFVEI